MCLRGEDEDGLTRREIVATGMLVSGYVLAGTPAFAQPQLSAPTRVLDDPNVEHGTVDMPHHGATTIQGYLARPKAGGVYPAVLVIAGNRITEEYIRNTCVALARAGYAALAPDVFHPLPPDAKPEEYGKYLDAHTELHRLDDVQAGASFLRSQQFVSAGGMGVLGFCRGGREAILHGIRSNEIDAVVAYHPAPLTADPPRTAVPDEAIARLRAAVLVHHGTKDTSVDIKHARALVARLRRAGGRVSFYEYEGAEHGFLAYTRQFYRADYALLSWRRTLSFLEGNLKSRRRR
jgi:carboxymethylenebutenolidase